MIYSEIENFEHELANLRFEPLYLDDFDAHVDEDREALNNLLFTRYGRTDTLNSVPSCVCGHLSGKDKEGQRCKVCGHECSPTYTRSIEPVLWVRVPDGIAYFVNPLIWKMLFGILKSGSNSILLWLTDPRYQPNHPHDPKMKRLSELFEAIPGFKRGINFFTENYETIINTMMDRKIINHRQLERSGILDLYKKYHDAFFTTVLPIPNRNTVVIEQNGTVLDADTMSLAGIDVFLTINNLHHRRINTPIPTKESEIAQCHMRLTTYYEKYYGDKLLSKQGKIRKHVVGARLNFTARAVITSIHAPHHYQELHIPWGVGVELFKEHIRSKLMHKHRIPPKDITSLLTQYVTRYHPLLDEVLKELIAESPYQDIDGNKMGFPCNFQRNPSLKRLSSQMFYISKVKTDRDAYDYFIDNTISISPLVITGMNADEHFELYSYTTTYH